MRLSFKSKMFINVFIKFYFTVSENVFKRHAVFVLVNSVNKSFIKLFGTRPT